MRTRSYLMAWVLLGGIACAQLQGRSAPQPKPWETATIVSVRRQEVQEPPRYGGDNLSDAPLQAEIFAYDIGVRTACGTYAAHYESAYDYLPEVFAANRQMPVRAGKHDIAFDLGYRQMQMPVARSKKDKTATCP